MSDKLFKIAASFQINSLIDSITEITEGNIHESFLVKTKGKDTPDFILQHKNNNVFRDIPSMMENIARVNNHIKIKTAENGLDPFRNSLTLIPVESGELYHVDEEGEYWTVCLFISDSITYSIPVDSGMAFSGGQCTGNFHKMLSDFKENLTDILPGFHNMRFRYNQWDVLMGRIKASAKSEFSREIDWIESRRDEMMQFQCLLEEGRIPRRIAHNDAKLLNILFDKNGQALCLIDLDTVLNGSVLYDFGDAIRSYTNTGEEDDMKLSNVSLNLDYFKAFTRGYLSEASSFLNNDEVNNLAFSARYITFEQSLRFLMDYLAGNIYYRIAYPDHNLQRAKAQYALLLDMEKQYENMRKFVLEDFEKSLQ